MPPTETRHDDSPPRPPCDAAAEAALLHWALECPLNVEVLQACKLGDLLHGFWEHRAIWNAIERAYAAPKWPLFPCDAFEAALLGELCQSECTGEHTFASPDEWPDGCRAPLFVRLVKPYWIDTAGGMQARRWATSGDEPADWVRRLRDCREARRLIAEAQEIAARAWRLDLNGARRAASRVAPISAPIKVEL